MLYKLSNRFLRRETPFVAEFVFPTIERRELGLAKLRAVTARVTDPVLALGGNHRGARQALPASRRHGHRQPFVTTSGPIPLSDYIADKSRGNGCRFGPPASRPRVGSGQPQER